MKLNPPRNICSDNKKFNKQTDGTNSANGKLKIQVLFVTCEVIYIHFQKFFDMCNSHFNLYDCLLLFLPLKLVFASQTCCLFVIFSPRFRWLLQTQSAIIIIASNIDSFQRSAPVLFSIFRWIQLEDMIFFFFLRVRSVKSVSSCFIKIICGSRVPASLQNASILLLAAVHQSSSLTSVI